MRPLGLRPWLRRALEAGILAALVAIVTLVGSIIRLGTDPVVLPRGPAGALVLAPGILALGVVTCGYPIAFAATRVDALLGSVAAFILAGDAVTFAVGTRITLGAIDRDAPAGLLVTGLAIVPALAGLLGAQLLTRLGFGIRAGRVSVLVAGGTAILVLAVAAQLG